eukprot:jgi/Galph1/5761/GphlegSOOS_G4361.1
MFSSLSFVVVVTRITQLTVRRKFLLQQGKRLCTKAETSTAHINSYSVGLPRAAYIHIPFCVRKCFYCDFAVIAGVPPIHNLYEQYVGMLIREINCTLSYLMQRYGKLPTLETLYFGGGTPSLLPPSLLKNILDTLYKYVPLSKNCEITMEMDPNTFTKTKAELFKSLGINRVSIGVQSFNDELLGICGRSHSSKDIYEAWNVLKQVGFSNVSLDLMSGLPQQNFARFQESIEKAILLNPSHISCYDLVLERKTPFGKKYSYGKAPLPSEDEAADMYAFASSRLREVGYEHYEISNYAKPGYDSQHNQCYWRNEAYYGFGLGATSYIEKKRVSRPPNLKHYINWVNDLERQKGEISQRIVTIEEQAVDTLMLGLRTRQGISLTEFEENFGEERTTQLVYAANRWMQSGYIFMSHKRDGKVEHLSLSDPDGFLLLNTILVALLEETFWK